MKRLRLVDIRLHPRVSEATGHCQGDIVKLSQLVNAAQEQLVYAREAGDEGWWGSWAEIAFEVDPANPNITLPRDVGRLQNVTIAEHPVDIRNQWYQYLNLGSRDTVSSCLTGLSLFSQNNVVTAKDMPDGPHLIRFYADNPADNVSRVFVQGQDTNKNTVRSMDGSNVVEGVFLQLEQPFVTAPMPFSKLTGLQKDTTSGPVHVWAVDPASGEETFLHTLEPGETTAWYRRYSLRRILAQKPVQVKAIVKLEMFPVRVDTDYLLIQSAEAMIEELNAIRLSGADVTQGKGMARVHHQKAISLLNGQLRHYVGAKEPTITFKPFGSATLERHAIGNMM